MFLGLLASRSIDSTCLPLRSLALPETKKLLQAELEAKWEEKIAIKDRYCGSESNTDHMPFCMCASNDIVMKVHDDCVF